MSRSVEMVNENFYDEPRWLVLVGLGFVWTLAFSVYAPNEQEAVDLVADYIEERRYAGAYQTVDTLKESCEAGESIEEAAEAQGYPVAATTGSTYKLQELRKCLDEKIEATERQPLFFLHFQHLFSLTFSCFFTIL